MREKNASEEFKNEREMLKRFGDIQHPHLVTLLATYHYQGLYRFIFPWADLDLDEYWNQKYPDGPGKGDHCGFVRWVFKQLQGLSGALQGIHGPTRSDGASLTVPGSDPEEIKYGRHGDIKPQNILWFDKGSEWAGTEQRGILVITDMGASAVHREVSRSNVPNQPLPCTPSYKPPECDRKGGKITRAYDIWTLGCVFLEMAIWMLEGISGRDDFRKCRTSQFLEGGKTDKFYDIKRHGQDGMCEFVLKESVLKVCQSPRRLLAGRTS